MAQAKFDNNSVPTIIAVDGEDLATPSLIEASPSTHALQVDDGSSAMVLPSAGLIGYWAFDEESGSTARDSSGNGIDGTISGAVYATGRINSALDFDGVDDRVTVPHNANQLLTSGFTLTAWIKPNTIGGDLGGGNQGGRIISKGGGSTETNGFRLLLATSGRFSIRVAAGTSLSSPNNSVTVGNNVWYHVAATVASDGLATLYVNGAVTGTPSTISLPSAITSTNALNIGARITTNDSNFDGLIDEVRIYNTVLTPTEILAVYNLGTRNIAHRDQNQEPTLIANSRGDGQTPVLLATDGNGKLLIQST